MAQDLNLNQRLIVNPTSDYSISLARNNTWEWWFKAYSNGAFAIHENGVGDILYIKAGGNVGIGTTSPNGKLQVDGDIYVNGADRKIMNYNGAVDYGTLTNNSVRFNTDGNERLRITGGGNVGIGTTSPVRKLHVSTGNTDIAARFENTTSNSTVMELLTSGDGKAMYFQTDHIYVSAGSMHFGNSTGDIYLRTSTAGGVGIGTTSPDRNLHVYQGNSGVTGYALTGGIDIESTSISGINILSPNAGYGRIYFGAPISNTAGAIEYIHNATLASGYMKLRAGGADRVFVLGNGNVGIGTTSPSYGLSVSGADNNIVASFDHTSFVSRQVGLPGRFMVGPLGNGYPEIGYNFTTTYSTYTKISNDTAWSINFGNGSRMSFKYAGAGTGEFSFTEHMVINTSGNVGIGTTSPSQKLEVVGDIRIGQNSAIRFNTSGSSNDPGLAMLSDASFVFYNTASSTTLKITNGGNVGIGTTSPGKKLDVAGQIRQIGGGDYWYVSSSATFTSSGKEVTLSRSSSGYVVATPYGALKKFNASVAFKTSNSTHLGITFLAADESPEDNNYAVILRSVNTVRIQKRVSGSQTYPINEISLTGTDIDDGNWHTISISFDGTYISVDVDGTNYISQTWTDTTWTSGMVGPTIYDGSVEFNDFSCSELTSKNVNSTLLVSDNVGIGTTSPGTLLDVKGKVRFGPNTNQSLHAALQVSAGEASNSLYRDIDIHGSWSTGESHAITATYGAQLSQTVGQMVFQFTNPGSRIKWGGFYHSGSQTTYPMELVSDGSNGNLILTGKLGVGNTSPSYSIDVSGGAIAIRGNAAGNSLRFDDSAGTSRNAFYVDTSNYLNIGNANYAGVKFVQTASAPNAGAFDGQSIQQAVGTTDDGVVLAAPDAWLAVRVGTTDYAIPMYTTG